MEPLWVSLGIIYDGFPCLSDAIVALTIDREKDDGQVDIKQQNWPIQAADGAPLMGSYAAIEFHYSKNQADVSSILSVVLLLLLILPLPD